MNQTGGAASAQREAADGAMAGEEAEQGGEAARGWPAAARFPLLAAEVVPPAVSRSCHGVRRVRRGRVRAPCRVKRPHISRD